MVRVSNPWFRLSAAAAVGGMVMGPVGADLAWAQVPAPAPAAAAEPAGDPPARVGRLSTISGTVSFHTAQQTQWEAATQNYPITSGNALWTQPGAGAAIDVAATHIALSEQTEFDIDTLDNTTLAATEPQGEAYLRIPAVQQGETYTIVTPRGSVSISGAARVDVAAGDTDTPTTVTVVDGAAQISGPNLSLSVGAHQTATITGSDSFQGSVGAETDSAFLAAQLRQEQPAASTASSYTPPPVVQEMTGAADLQTTGSWSQTSDYGEVWYPPVDNGWVPYRDGHWANVAPWGWTWVDNARWGFAPFHYGRWVQVGDRWGWTPGEAQAEGGGYGYAGPVYAPALVNFVGIGLAAAAGAAIGAALAGNIGWAPLGYREPYYPPYYVSRGYFGGINARYVPRADFTRVTNNYTHIYVNRSVNTTVINNYYGRAARDRFANGRAATFVPAAALARREPVAQHLVRVTPQEVAQARPLAALPVRPEPRAAVARPAPGPAVRPMPRVGEHAPAAALPRPALQPRPAGAPRPGTPPAARPEPAGRPAGLPPLATPRAGLPVARPGSAPGPAIVPRPGIGARPAEPAPRPGEPAQRPLPPPRPAAAVPSPARPVPPPAIRPGPAPMPAPTPAPRPVPEAHPAPAPRPAAPVARPAPVPSRPAPAVVHPAPVAPRPPAPVIRPAPAPRPAPPPRPAPAARPEPAPRPAPVARPAPPPPPRPAPPPAPRPAPPPPPRPAPPPPPRPAPPPPHRPCPPGVRAC